jgi:alkylated DNA repair dioxygenase AlkB
MNSSQHSLPGLLRDLPDGFAYHPDLVPPQQERELLDWFRMLPFKEFEFHGHRGKRRVVYFGIRYDFNESKLFPAEQIPAVLLPLRAVAADFAGLDAQALQHALVTEYAPGAGIGWHKDRPDFADVIGVSFGSSCWFRLRRRTDRGWDRAAALLEPRSAYLLRGAVRSDWEHSIAPMHCLRYSVTFRSMKTASR